MPFVQLVSVAPDTGELPLLDSVTLDRRAVVRGVHELSVSDVDAGMAATVEDHHVAGLGLVVGDRATAAELAVAVTRDRLTGLLVGPVDEARAVEGIRAGRAVGVRRADLALRGLDGLLTGGQLGLPERGATVRTELLRDLVLTDTRDGELADVRDLDRGGRRLRDGLGRGCAWGAFCSPGRAGISKVPSGVWTGAARAGPAAAASEPSVIDPAITAFLATLLPRLGCSKRCLGTKRVLLQFLPVPPTELAVGFGPEEWPYAFSAQTSPPRRTRKRF